MQASNARPNSKILQIHYQFSDQIFQKDELDKLSSTLVSKFILIYLSTVSFTLIRTVLESIPIQLLTRPSVIKSTAIFWKEASSPSSGDARLRALASSMPCRTIRARYALRDPIARIRPGESTRDLLWFGGSICGGVSRSLGSFLTLWFSSGSGFCGLGACPFVWIGFRRSRFDFWRWSMKLAPVTHDGYILGSPLPRPNVHGFWAAGNVARYVLEYHSPSR